MEGYQRHLEGTTAKERPISPQPLKLVTSQSLRLSKSITKPQGLKVRSFPSLPPLRLTFNITLSLEVPSFKR